MWYIEKKNITTFNIIWECNLVCPFCSWYPKIEFSLEKIKNNIKWLEEITLQWWEPTLSPDLVEIIWFARANWTRTINLITNWIKFSDINFAEKIAWTIDSYHFAFMSHKKEISDKLWASYSVLFNKTKALLNLIKLWEAHKIRLVYIIQKDNLDDIEWLPIYINKYFPWIKLIEFKYLQYFWNKNNITNIVSYTKSKTKINNAMNICKKLKIDYIINWIPLCFLEEKFHEKSASYYNDNNEEVMSQYSTLKLKKCEKCIYSKSCVWIRQDYINLIWDNEFR